MTDATYIDLKNAIERIDDKVDAGLRLLKAMAHHLATDPKDTAKTVELSRKLAEGTAALEAVLEAHKRPPT